MNDTIEKECKYAVIQKQSKEVISPIFDTKDEAEGWLESNGIDYDYYKIKKLPQ